MQLFYSIWSADLWIRYSFLYWSPRSMRYNQSQSQMQLFTEWAMSYIRLVSMNICQWLLTSCMTRRRIHTGPDPWPSLAFGVALAADCRSVIFGNKIINMHHRNNYGWKRRGVKYKITYTTRPWGKPFHFSPRIIKIRIFWWIKTIVCKLGQSPDIHNGARLQSIEPSSCKTASLSKADHLQK